MKVTICIGSFCHVKGAPQVVAELQRLVREHQLMDKVELAGKFCMKKCQDSQRQHDGVNVTIGQEEFEVLPAAVEQFFNENILAKV